ncbi:MAG: extracellular solute-binding protein, partial [Clostridia bacterium]
SQIKYVFGVPVNIQGPLLYYRKDLLPQDWETTYDKNNNKVPDMVENWSALYKYSQKILEESAGKKFGYMRSLYDVYFSSGYLFTYGAYVFGNGGTDTKDIGFSKGDAVKGANIVKQLATVMDRGCVDVTITSNCYSRMADGTYFATMTTPDVYSLFIKEMVIDYQRKDKSLSTEDATAKAIENLVVTDVPMLPKSGDLNDTTGEMIPTKMMGGINGYAISSYTEYPNAALAFVNFATNYDMIQTRISTLGIVPARKDLAIETGGLASIINKNLQEGNIAVMPSVRAVAQIWSPTETFFADLAEDAFREEGKKKYVTEAQMLAGLQLVDKQIYDAINTLK